MLALTDLLNFADELALPKEKRRGLVREYLQTLILFYLQQSPVAPKIIFIGGTALRFFYNLQRFSEDLDFNCRGNLRQDVLAALMASLKQKLAKENLRMEYVIHQSQETYFHWKVYLQFLDVLQHYGCGGRISDQLHPQEKLSIQLDFQNLGKKRYPIVKKIISHFGMRFLFYTTELNMFLAEKTNAILYRNPPRARDFFDFMSLVDWRAGINYQYLKMRQVEIKNLEEYKIKIQERVKELPFKKLVKALTPFLFQAADVAIMKDFPQYIDDILTKIT